MNALVVAALLRRQMDSVLAAMPREVHPQHRRRSAPAELPAFACRWLLRHPADVPAASSGVEVAALPPQATVAAATVAGATVTGTTQLGPTSASIRYLPSLRSRAVAVAGHSIE